MSLYVRMAKAPGAHPNHHGTPGCPAQEDATALQFAAKPRVDSEES